MASMTPFACVSTTFWRKAIPSLERILVATVATLWNGSTLSPCKGIRWGRTGDEIAGRVKEPVFSTQRWCKFT